LTPYLSKDKALAYSLFSVQNVPQEVKEHYRNNAIKSIESYHNKYAHLLETMETKNY
jgi:predicted phosphoadenosine phosphosulfate sulfurtransferase